MNKSPALKLLDVCFGCQYHKNYHFRTIYRFNVSVIELGFTICGVQEHLFIKNSPLAGGGSTFSKSTTCKDTP